MSCGTAARIDPADVEAVADIVKRAGTSFYRGMKVLPFQRRAAMYAIYAFCRLVDDIADEPAPMDQKRRQLAEWRERIDAVLAGVADDPVTRVLAAACAEFQLRREDFMAIIDGMQTDAETEIVAPTLAELDLYCDQVASAVGRLSVRAFGDASPRADEVAYHLGRALQLTNILRDLAEDAARNRLYLPAELLDRHRVPHDPAAALVSPGLPHVCQDIAVQARAHFRAADVAMSHCNSRAMKPARLMGAMYAALLERLAATRFRHPEQRVSVPKWRKLWIAVTHAI